MRRISVFALTLLCSCARLGEVSLTTQPVGVDAGLAAWRHVVQDSSLSPSALASALERQRKSRGIPLSLWPADTLSDALRSTLMIGEHPCGENVIVLAARMPADTSALEGDLILEYDERGRFVRRWRVPTDEIPVGVRGEYVLLDGPRAGVVLAVHTDGRFMFRVDAAVHPGTYEKCPRVPALEPSDYLQCTHFIDRGRVRRIAYQGVCT